MPTPARIPLPGADLLLFDSLRLEDEAGLLDRLIRDTPWRQEDITLFGRTHRQPRLVAWYGDPGASYRYSGIDNEPLPWTPGLRDLRRRVEEACGAGFNSVLLNYYRDGRDAMGMHADDEPELGPRPVIASLSLGATRRLRFVHRRREEAPLGLSLPSGSRLVAAHVWQCW